MGNGGYNGRLAGADGSGSLLILDGLRLDHASPDRCSSVHCLGVTSGARVEARQFMKVTAPLFLHVFCF